MSTSNQAASWDAESTDNGQWVIAAACPGRAIRFHAPVDSGYPSEDVWIEARALTHQEALERESVGVFEEYELADSGRVVFVSRRYDLWAMAEYDYLHALVDFCLPERTADGEVHLRRAADGTPESNIMLLAAMPSRLANWIQDCIDRVNLRDPLGQAAMDEAKKKPASC